MLRVLPLVSDAAATWVDDRFHWLIGTFGARRFFETTRLMLPTGPFFGSAAARTPWRVEAIFDEVRTHMGLTDRPIQLEPRAAIRRDARIQVAGSYFDGGGGAVITYDPRLCATPHALVGTLAHELGHARLSDHVASAPGGEAEHERLTDLAVVHGGLGLIDLIGTHRLGWQSDLEPETRAYALATFMALKGLDPSSVGRFLDPKLRRRLTRAWTQRQERSDQLVLLEALCPPALSGHSAGRPPAERARLRP